MHFKKLFILLFIFQNSALFSQMNSDFTFVLHENTINKVFKVIGDITGKNEYEVMLIKGHYTWTLINPKINLLPDSSDFRCDVKVQVGPFSYQSQVLGNVKITYDNKKNEISLRISKAVFELYTVIFGSKIHIKDIHLEEQFKDPFVFEGPQSLTTDMEFTMPDSTLKKVYIQPKKCEMKVVKYAIVTECDLEASDKPFKKTLQVNTPIKSSQQNTKPSNAKSTTN